MAGMRMHGIRKKLYLFVYDKPGVNKKALQLRQSLDEVKKELGKRGKSRQKS